MRGPRPTPRQLVRAGVVIALCSILVPIATAGTVIASYLFLPLPANIPAPHLTPASNVTRLYDVNLQQQIGTVRAFETNIPVQPKDIPDVLKQAVVATEDRRFVNHGGE